MSSLMPHGMHTHYTVSGDTHTHTHTHMQVGRRWKVFSAFNPSWHPPPGTWPGAVGGQQCGARGPSPSARSCRGQGQDRRASVLLHVFVMGFYGGNPGEHGENMQTPHRKAREQAPTCCTMRDLNPQPSCCEATVLCTEPPCPVFVISLAILFISR